MESRPNLIYMFVVSVISLQPVLPVLFESMGSTRSTPNHVLKCKE